MSLLLTKAYAECEHDRDLVIIGDSQIGATWSRSYIGNYLNECLKHESNLNYVIYGRGATTIGNWIDRTHLDHIEVIQRTRSNPHENIGAHQAVPMCKKRLDSILKSHLPQTLVLSFGGNWIGQDEKVIRQEINKAVNIINKQSATLAKCYFITPTFEMAVDQRRSVPRRTLEAVKQVTEIIHEQLQGHCQLINGVDLMADSSLLDKKTNTLKRIPIPSDTGCSGAAVNDNVHVCGEAAREMAYKICEKILN